MADITLAASEAAFTTLFNAVRDKVDVAKADARNFGRFTASYDLRFHLEGGTVDLRSDNTVQVKELDIKWDRLDLALGIDIPEICVGGFCIIKNPFNGRCIVRAPRICIFSGDPDVTLRLPLSGITSELSLTGSLTAKHFNNPDRPSGMNDWDAREASPPLNDSWRLFLVPRTVDIDPIDVADTVGDLLVAAMNAAIDGLLGFLPVWARDLIRALLGPVIDLIRFLLDIGDDIQEWVSDLLNISFGLLDFIAQLLLQQFATQAPLAEMEDPYPLLPAVPNPNGGLPAMLVPVLLPLRDLRVFNDDAEMVLEASLG